VIITGASSGIGEAAAKLLASKGAKVVLGARREDKLKHIVDAIGKDGGHAVYQELDVTKQSENDDIVNLAKETFGGVDVIFLNAGIMPNSPLSALKTDDWHQMIDVNVKGVLNGVAAVLPAFIEQNHFDLVGRRAQGLPGRRGLRRDEVVRARLHGGPPHGVGHGGDEHSHHDDLSRRDQHRAAGRNQRQGNGGVDARSVRRIRDLTGPDRQRRGFRHRPARGHNDQRVHGRAGQPTLVRTGDGALSRRVA
jgi:short chain dehydrogenase